LDVKLLTQPYLSTGEEFFFGDKIISLLSAKKPKFRSISFMFGLIKANVLPKLEPYIVDFLSNGGIINFYIDLDKKINSKPIMSELLALGCNIYIFSPKDSLAEFQYRGVIFETSKKAEILLSSGNFSLNGL
jgi:hypothetical protein